LVFHLAAETHVDTSLTNPFSHFNNNTKATLNLLILLNLALIKKVLTNKFKFIHIGTDEIYGDVNFNSKKMFDENQKFDPSNPYSASKAAAVLMVRTWFKNFNFPCIITNCVNNFGQFQFVEKFIPRSILLGINKKNIEVYGKGKNIRTWISVKDHVSALIFLSRYGKLGETYNISNNFKLNNLQIAKRIKHILKSKNINAKIKFIKDRIGHDKHYSISFNKLKKLGWKPEFNFDNELHNTVNWYVNQNHLKYFRNINTHLKRKGRN
jgi:dTDP-glucose 4,6-dehydratase